MHSYLKQWSQPGFSEAMARIPQVGGPEKGACQRLGVVRNLGVSWWPWPLLGAGLGGVFTSSAMHIGCGDLTHEWLQHF